MQFRLNFSCQVVNFCAVPGCASGDRDKASRFFYLPTMITHQGEQTRLLSERWCENAWLHGCYSEARHQQSHDKLSLSCVKSHHQLLKWSEQACHNRHDRTIEYTHTAKYSIQQNIVYSKICKTCQVVGSYVIESYEYGIAPLIILPDCDILFTQFQWFFCKPCPSCALIIDFLEVFLVHPYSPGIKLFCVQVYITT